MKEPKPIPFLIRVQSGDYAAMSQLRDCYPDRVFRLRRVGTKRRAHPTGRVIEWRQRGSTGRANIWRRYRAMKDPR